MRSPDLPTISPWPFCFRLLLAGLLTVTAVMRGLLRRLGGTADSWAGAVP